MKLFWFGQVDKDTFRKVVFKLPALPIGIPLALRRKIYKAAIVSQSKYHNIKITNQDLSLIMTTSKSTVKRDKLNQEQGHTLTH